MDTFVTGHLDPAPLSAEHLDAAGCRAALAEVQRAQGSDPLAPLDAVIHGVRVRLYTNSIHWRHFWSANWFAPSQWTALTGGVSPEEPWVHVYVVTADAGASP
jgi:hypothetical protein